MKVLVTGARAPSALEIIRRLSSAGFEVYAADCMRFPAARFSRHVRGYLCHPSPRQDLEGYVRSLEQYAAEYKIDIIFPTCEEVFYLSAIKPQLEKTCRVFCEDFSRLSALHNKALFQDIARDNGMGFIETRVIAAPSEADDIISRLSAEKLYVLKPVFSRFGDQAVIRLGRDAIKAQLKPELYPWAVQEFIEGQEYCTYALCNNGIVYAESCYLPAFRAGQGASVYFQPVKIDEISRQVRSLAAGLGFYGQIGFDFIVTAEGKAFVLECNPRCTSGAHLLQPDIDWVDLLKPCGLAGRAVVDAAGMSGPKMVGLAMLVYGQKPPNAARRKDFWRAFGAAKDVTWWHDDGLPFFGQALSLLEIIFRSRKYGQSFKEAATADIEWNGQRIV